MNTLDLLEATHFTRRVSITTLEEATAALNEALAVRTDLEWAVKEARAAVKSAAELVEEMELRRVW